MSGLVKKLQEEVEMIKRADSGELWNREWEQLGSKSVWLWGSMASVGVVFLVGLVVLG